MVCTDIVARSSSGRTQTVLVDQSIKKPSRPHAKCAGKRDDIQQGNIPFSPFDSADVVAVKAGQLSKLFL
jgi:hypothetical protein